MNNLVITIEGRPGSGKTAISKLIQQALMREGIVTAINDEDGPAALIKHNSTSSLHTLKERVTTVTINQRTQRTHQRAA